MAALRIGLISDTHGLLRPQAMEALAGVAHIVHAGDIGDAGVIAQLQGIAPLSAIRGNNDAGAWAADIPETLRLEIGGVTLYVLHDVKQLDLDPEAQGIDVVVAGHSHKPCIERRGGTLFVNPGSAGPRRFKLPVSLGFLEIGDGEVVATLRTLTV
ncbi:MAG TPA: metallophosphoesterase family protein [Paucimonas sp.]|nr:metallophosphoesterase family protein [Paucimonas sp.]